MLTGIGIGAGNAAGPAARLAPAPVLSAPRTLASAEVPGEAAAVRAALREVATDLAERAATVTGAAAEVLSANAMTAADPALADRAAALVLDGTDGAHALTGAFGEFRAALVAAGGYFAERVADLDDLRDRSVARLLGLPMPGLPVPGHPYVPVAEDLAPADTALLDPGEVLALVTERGGPTSHTSILAKALRLPAGVGCADAGALADGRTVLVDAAAGTVATDPTPQAVTAAAERERLRRERAGRAHGPGRTADGEGVGLFRTEFLYLDRAEAPSVAEQTDAYRTVFAAFAGRWGGGHAHAVSAWGATMTWWTWTCAGCATSWPWPKSAASSGPPAACT
ncbi:PEP-utilizing enzyme [Actinacidiphila acididurans]|uniref:PEP-utilizing enzyme n=1 Tax=Actinacidiphila acididurans TaxID=2784346 RepID=UPI0027DDF2BB|nr:PEP-utilizing enzyme [Actinacidiphila acididurans]